MAKTCKRTWHQTAYERSIAELLKGRQIFKLAGLLVEKAGTQADSSLIFLECGSVAAWHVKTWAAMPDAFDNHTEFLGQEWILGSVPPCPICGACPRLAIFL